MFLVNSQIYSNRISICKKCDYYKPLTRSCGTLGIGQKLLIEGTITVELCGCVMPVKAKLKTGSCPIGKWEAVLSSREVREAKEFLEGIKNNRITGEQNKKLTEIWNNATGGNRKLTNCNACVRDMIKDLRNL